MNTLAGLIGQQNFLLCLGWTIVTSLEYLIYLKKPVETILLLFFCIQCMITQVFQSAIFTKICSQKPNSGHGTCEFICSLRFSTLLVGSSTCFFTVPPSISFFIRLFLWKQHHFNHFTAEHGRTKNMIR